MRNAQIEKASKKEIKDVFKSFKKRYGEFEIIKVHPNRFWGDTLRTNKRTKNIVRVPDLSQKFKLVFANKVPVDSITQELSMLPEVKFSEPPIIAYTCLAPNDPLYANDWASNAISAEGAWDITTGNSNITISINDRFGTDIPPATRIHDDLAGKVISHKNRFGDHGTSVAGVAGANTNNNLGVASLGWNLSLRFHNWVAEDIDEAVTQGVDIINFSWITSSSTAVADECEAALAQGVVLVAAAGNQQGPPPAVWYPAAHNFGATGQVIAVSATEMDANQEVWVDWWNYSPGTDPIGNPTTGFIDCSAPGVAIPIATYESTYSLYGQGTSLAAPRVSALVGLILSIDNTLTPNDIYDIITRTTEKVGINSYDVNGWNRYLGYGRINANQAVLLALAYANKSTTYYASGYNNNHTIERGYSGKLHEVFHGGGEIFYRRSSNSGSIWEITTRLSSGNGSNDAPSIVAGYSDVLCAVWQNKIDSRHYNIMYSFSSNSGTSWTTPAIVAGCSNVWISYYQSEDYYGPGPTPVIASFFQGGSEGSSSFLLVFAAENGLHYRYANSYSSGWSIPSNDIVPGSYGSSSQIWYPSLASYNSQDYHVNLIYGVRFGSPNQIYSQIFNDDYPDGSWLSRAAVDWVGTYNRCPSLALDYANNTLSVWSGWNGSIYTTRFRQGFSDGTWSSWMKEWSVSGYNSFNPVITYYNKGGSYPYGIDILWYTSNNQIRQKKYYGLGDNWIPADPNTQLLASNGICANITHERQNTVVPMQTWTDQSTSPVYSILYNSSYLPKENLLASGEIRRAALIGDVSGNSNLSIALSQPVLRTLNGDEIVVPFKEYDYSAKIDLTTANVFDYLQTEPFNITNDIETISFKVSVTASQPDTLSDRTVNTNHQTPFSGINFDLLAKENSSQLQLASVGSQTLNNALGLHNITKTFTFNAQVLKGKEIYLLPKVNLNGSFKPDNLHFGLVNISIEGSPVLPKDLLAESITPKEYLLEQNYPNPFNPATTITYQLPKDGLATLKIFDILGNEIRTLVNEQKETGKYTVHFDASSLASGMYVYQLRVNDYIAVKKMMLVK